MVNQGYEITKKGVGAYREANDLTWHEENNMKSMHLMHGDINGKLGHLGGVGKVNNQSRGKEYTNEGLENDEIKQSTC